MPACEALRKRRAARSTTYDGPVADLWDLWTTKDGFESWWGPEGFRVEVSKAALAARRTSTAAR